MSSSDEASSSITDNIEPTVNLEHSFYESSEEGPLRQGEILSGVVVTILRRDIENVMNQEALLVTFPYSIVVTQDCDLEQDYLARYSDSASKHRLMSSILFCEVELADLVRHGSDELPEDKKARASNINSKAWKIISQNKDERFHYLTGFTESEDKLSKGSPHLAIEFKRYFTVPTEEIYYQISTKKAARRCRLKSPYLEHFSSRFNYYHSRVALPRDHLTK